MTTDAHLTAPAEDVLEQDADQHDLDEVAAGPTFAEIGVQAQIVAALAGVGITHPFPIQAMTLPVALTGHDIIGQAKTGTGKTLGFGIPVLQRVVAPGEEGFDALEAPGKPQALVVVPTRELAVQVAGDLATAGKLRSVRVLTVYGGRAYEPQVEALAKGVEVVVGTPGRLLDLMQQKYLSLAHARMVVLDEADEMLDLGFLPDVEKLLAQTPAGRQTMLFSATMPAPVVSLARSYMTQPTHIRAADPDDTGATVKATKQHVYRAHALDKVEMLARMLQARERGLTIVFARTKRTVAKVADELTERGFAVGAIHGDLGQGAREQALRAFRKGKVDVLVATDVAARGIDVDDVTHVVNYQCPEDEKTYLHRIGRTGRAGNTGTAVTFVDWDDLHRWTMIDKTLDLGIPEPLETYSSSPHLYTDLDIPEGTKGTLPRAARTRAGLDAEVVEDLGETGQRQKGGRGGGRSGARGESRTASDAPRSRRRSPGADTVEAPEGAPQGADADQPPAAPARSRQRRRTRGGVPVEAGATSTETGAAATAPAAQSEAASGGEAGQDGTSAPRRRRRRRGGSGRGTGADLAPAAPAEG
ncbi:MAG TPA: DEAD/DEAH box helicase [Kineosporiaceae bacterium]|nr:DEAD/DEAH box helicase [Kineosporiaceae bacterium]